MWLVTDGETEPRLKIIVGWDAGCPVTADADLINTNLTTWRGRWSAFTDADAAAEYFEQREGDRI